MTKLRQRMLEELQRRNYSPSTARQYLRDVAAFAEHFHRSPDRLGAEHIRDYQLFLIREKKLAWSTYNQIVCALRFFYIKVLKRTFLLADIPFTRKQQKLPSILRAVPELLYLVSTVLKPSGCILRRDGRNGLRYGFIESLRGASLCRTQELFDLRPSFFNGIEVG